MKRFVLVLAALSILAAGVSAQTLDGFQTAFQTFAEDMAGVLAANSTVGNVWSHAYVGGFPRFGAGLAVGANFVPADSAEPLFAAAGETLPAELANLGIPIPAAALSFKIGLPFLNMDVGVKGGLIPDSASGVLSGQGIEATYETLGINVRYAILKDRLMIPAVSIGASWNYLKGSIATGLGAGDTTYTDGATYSVTVSDPDLTLDWQANTFDFTLQASKNLLIFTPYVGAGFTIGVASTSGGMAATTTVADYNTSGSNADEIAALEAAGISVSDQGFSVSSEVTTPTIRIYGGTSINILILKLDLMASYVPATQALGAQVMARIQL
ncbi:MAG TPA: hypothetical protein P5313_11015 [Spirochaetia bacterium]|nr:hypothetical protein [Spirochaetales bacterium]HRY80936.1 hypothetical protein [Spirochaetia bacterium]